MLYATLLVFFHVRLTALKFKQGGSQGFDIDSYSLPKPSSHLLYTFSPHLLVVYKTYNTCIYCQDISVAAVYIHDPLASFPIVIHPIPIVLPRIIWGSHSPQMSKPYGDSVGFKTTPEHELFRSIQPFIFLPSISKLGTKHLKTWLFLANYQNMNYKKYTP